eukprot:gene23068-30260_t
MGVKFEITRDPDYRKVAKKLVKVDKPCTVELIAMMDCMKRKSATDADTGCMRERSALMACAAASKGAISVSQAKTRMLGNMQRLVGSWKRYGY